MSEADTEDEKLVEELEYDGRLSKPWHERGSMFKLWKKSQEDRCEHRLNGRNT